MHPQLYQDNFGTGHELPCLGDIRMARIDERDMTVPSAGSPTRRRKRRKPRKLGQRSGGAMSTGCGQGWQQDGGGESRIAGEEEGESAAMLDSGTAGNGQRCLQGDAWLS